MTELRAERSRFSGSHYFDTGSDKVYSSFGFVLEGKVTLKSMGRRIDIPEGGLFYLPEGIRYKAVWDGNPNIDFISLHIISRRPDISTSERYAMAYIEDMSTPETKDRFVRIYNLFSTGEKINLVRAIGIYYLFFSEVLQYLQPEPPVRLNPALITAIEYIESNYGNNFSITELAEHCCISESRLFHIFRNELGMTPIKYRNEIRVEKAAEILRASDITLEDVAERCGFNSVTYFRETFREYTGLTPTEYRNIVSA